jgi:hypothetical protein
LEAEGGLTPSAMCTVFAESELVWPIEVLEQVAHAMRKFSLPKMIRPYFIHHPELRGKLCRTAYETVQEVMDAASIGTGGFRTGMVAITATAGDLLNLNPHGHAIVPRGRRRKGKDAPLKPEPTRDPEDDGLTDGQRRARRREWARLIRRVYEVDPSVCEKCGGEIKIISVILEHKVIRKILGHLAGKGITPGRDPPVGSRTSQTVDSR